MIAYAGLPSSPPPGASCVIDHRPRTWTTDQLALLEDVASAVLTRIRAG